MTGAGATAGGTRGRALRFMGVLVAGWLAARTVLLWPEPPRPAAATAPDDFIPHALARLDPRPVAAGPADAGFLPFALVRDFLPGRVPPPAATTDALARPRSGTVRAAAPPLLRDGDILALFGMRHYVELPLPGAPTVPPQPAAFSPDVAATVGAPLPRTMPSRWRLSGWLIARPGGGDPRLVPLLGGSQAGARLSHALGDGRRVAAFARVGAPLSAGGTEAAVGMEWRMPVVPAVSGAAYAELRHRAGLGLAPAVGIYGGLHRTTAAFRLDGYGQAGMVGGRAATGFVDAQLRATRRIGPDLDAGLGAWGSAQRGAARLDIGPTLGVALPLSERRARLSLDWRQRIAGTARPGSGIAISLGADF